jgi:hypothetical protein
MERTWSYRYGRRARLCTLLQRLVLLVVVALHLPRDHHSSRQRELRAVDDGVHKTLAHDIWRAHVRRVCKRVSLQAGIQRTPYVYIPVGACRPGVVHRHGLCRMQQQSLACNAMAAMRPVRDGVVRFEPLVPRTDPQKQT